jgi:glutamate-1-semialdehyde 2,1-aminomutase
MRKHGIYVPEMHTMLLNNAHEDGDIDLIVDSFRESVREMVEDKILLTNG